MLGKFLYTKKKETEHHQKFACQSSESERPGREIRRAKCETERPDVPRWDSGGWDYVRTFIEAH